MLDSIVLVQIILVGIASAHAYFSSRFQKLIKEEKPEWISVQTKFARIYDSIRHLKAHDGSFGITRTVFSSRYKQLKSPHARMYVYGLRFCMFCYLLLFVICTVFSKQVLG